MAMFWPGVIAIWAALAAGIASVVLYLRVDRGRKDLLPAARSAYTVFAASIVAASGVLLTLLIQHRFDVAIPKFVNDWHPRAAS